MCRSVDVLVTIMSSQKRASESSTGDTRPKKRTSKRNNNSYPAEINPKYTEPSFREQLKEAFVQRKKFQDNTGALYFADPFPFWVLPNFIGSHDFLNTLKEELLGLDFHKKSNDLYQFRQSNDLKTSHLPHVVALRNMLEKDCHSWLKELTDIDLNDKVDMTCSIYNRSDVLLCHDDELEERRIAFILYLGKKYWTSNFGGSLAIFNSDEHGQPGEIVNSFNPVFNNFIFFEVSAKSFHQVNEVLIDQRASRLSVSGWFHGPPLKRPQPYIQPPPILDTYLNITPEILELWINPVYLELETQSEVQSQFQQDSEIELHDFIKKEKFDEILAAIHVQFASDMNWQVLGPANHRNYERADESSLPEVLVECLRLFRSEAMMLLLSNLTGLRLHPLISTDSESEGEEADAEDREQQASCSSSSPQRKKKQNSDTAKCDPKCYGEMRRWKKGSYTLLHDSCQDSQNMLDSLLFFSCQGWQSSFGGYTSYIAKGEDEELLTVNPSDNSLALVYRDTESLKFVKYVNHRVLDAMKGGCFYDMSFIYCE